LILLLVANATFAVVGSIPGEFAVAPSGAATYTIPIQVPPGIAGMQPTLSLAYGSQGGNGELGMGWSLNGLSVIHRCSATRAQDGYKGFINYDRWDRFCLDGQRLVGPTAPTQTGPDQYRWDFRPEIWDQSEVVGYNVSGTPNNDVAGSGPEWFKVRTKSGLIMEFGRTEDSRIEAQGRTDVRVWALNKIEDTNGNYVKIIYNEDNANGEYFPIRIEYTGNDAAGISPTRSIEFQYTPSNTRSDTIVNYVGGAKVSTSVLLTHILTRVGADIAQDYALTYATSIGTKRSILKNIQQCSPNDCLPITQFSWQEGDTLRSAINYSANGMYPGSAVYRVDIDGDGVGDLLFWNKTTGELHLHPVKDGIVQPATDNRSSFNAGMAITLGDFSGKGKTEILFYNKNTLQLSRIENGIIQPPVSSGNILESGDFGTLSDLADMQVLSGDFDAWGGTKDGPTDVLFWNKLTKQFVVLAANEDGKFINRYSSFVGHQYVDILPGDYNGDGITDVAFWDKAGGNLWIHTIENAQLQPESDSRLNFEVGADLVVGDFNGDGITDFAFYQAGGSLAIYPASDGKLQAQTYGATTHVGAQVHAADYNNDGVSDLAFWNNASGEMWIHPVRQGVPQAADYALANFYSSDAKESGFFPADFNGDGVVDLLYWIKESGTLTLLTATNAYPDLVKTITDGIGAALNITYLPLSDISVYTKENDSQYPVVDIAYPIYVVGEYSTGNGLGGLYSVSHHYAGAKLDLNGRGLLGFHWMEASDLQTDVRTRTTYRQDFPYIGQPEHVEKYLNQTLIESEAYTWTHHVIASGVYLPYGGRTETKNYELDGSLIKAIDVQTETNTWGNVTSITETTTSGNISYVKTISNIYYPPDIDKWHLGQLKRATVKNIVPQHWGNSLSAGPNVRVSAFEYYDNGQLKSEIIEPDNLANRLTTTYEYDDFGNKIKSTVIGSDVAPRITYASYSLNQGYVPDSSTNAEGHLEEYRDYDLRIGKPRKIWDPNQLITYRSYDDFGSLASETLPDGTVATITRNFCVAGGSCPASAAYFETTTKAGSGSVTVYYDALRREVRKEAQGFDGRAIYQDTEYDTQLRAKRKSRPYFSGTTSYWSWLDYDTLGRVSQETAPDGGITTYSYYGFQTTAVADAGGKNQVSIRWNNAIGQLIRVQDANGKSNYYDYDPFGNLTYVKDALGNISTMSYDVRGRKVAMNDPDMGHWEYRYFTTGELKWQKDAKGSITEIKYDRVGRMVERAEPEGISKWKYDIAANGVGKLAEVYGPNGTSEIHTYDNLGRSKSIQYNYGLIDQNSSYTTTTDYDQYSRVEYVTYPSTGFKIRNYYNSLGFLTGVVNITDPQAPVTLWLANVYEADGQLSSETFGNTLTSNRNYSPSTGLVSAIVTGANASVQNLAYQFDKLGNLEWRKDQNQSFTESFTYDQLNRLKTVSLNGAATKSYDYDAIGNIIYKSDVGYYQYTSSRPHAVTQVAPAPRPTGTPVPGDANGDGVINALDQFAAIQHILGQGNATGLPDCHQDNGVNVQDTMCINKKVAAAGNTTGNYLHYSYDANGNMTSGGGRTISYTSFNMPSLITQGGSETRFIYGADHQRIRQANAQGSTSYVNAYYEKVIKNGVTEHHHYILGAVGVIGEQIIRSDGTSATLYFHKDHLGSIETITDATGAVKERFSFDPFGSRRMTNWQPAGSSSLGSALTNRGYTGHEQLDNIGLVHMNARLYDPMLGRFLSPDPMVKYPQSTQGFNRYSYTDNNPLSRVDFSGYGWLSKTWKKFWNNGGREFTAIAAGIALSYVNPVLAGFVSSYIYSRGDLRVAVMGALSAGAFYGVGTLTSTWSSEVAKVAAHGVTGGIMSELTGGSFKEGFLGAAVAKGFSGPIEDYLPNTRSAHVFAAAIVGGTASKLGGGSFANGAATGAFSRLFNDELHRTEQQKLNRPLTADERAIYAEYFPSEVLDSVRVYEGEVPWWLRSDMDGITLGNKIYFRDGIYAAGTASGVEILGHEIVHVQQYSEGMTVTKYLWASRNGYWNNPYEKQAYDKGALIRDNFCSANSQATGC